MEVILHPLICGLELGCEILLHWSLGGEWNVISHLETQFWMNNDLPFKTNLLPLLKIRENERIRENS